MTALVVPLALSVIAGVPPPDDEDELLLEELLEELLEDPPVPHCGAVVARLEPAPAVANTRHLTCAAGATASE
ncbi:hypothetical protein [Aquimonas sp.]|uniref:hypothetical protein n=1 Tax=Aquimonas sp. TaxID=1872588 RepID=UPI0037C0EDE7